jgi:ATP phosphoribosyltransferase regulatory subunit
MVHDLMEWRKKGFRVLGFNHNNHVSPSDYRMMAVYRDGLYEMNGQKLTKKEIEEKLGGMQ